MRGKLGSRGNLFILFVVTLFSFGFSGCSVLTPYESEFQCTAPYKGKCIDVNGAYKESKLPDSTVGEQVRNGKGGKQGEIAPAAAPVDTKEEYRNSLQRELSSLIEAPVTPVIVPPRVMRILVFPYPDKSVLYMPRYIYIMTDKPEWVMGNYLIGREDN